MKKILKIIVTLLFTLTFCPQAHALEIDEKLTTRFLKISGSNKTVLINRGLEDGLVVGDHAKFFLTTGVIARGVVVKASPTRSIWSIYRIVNRDKLYKDLAVNIKITNPVEITDDPTKSIYVTSAQTDVEIVRGDTDKLNTSSMSNDEKSELESVGDVSVLSSSMGTPQIDLTRSWEFFGLVNFSSGAGVVDEGNDQDFDSEGVIMDFSIGVEKYFSSSKGFLGQLSLFGLLHSGSQTVTSIEGQRIDSSVFEYGGGVNYHFLSSPLAVSRFIPYVSASFGVGSVSTQTQFVGNNFAAIDNDTPTEGSSSFLSFGAGAKYFTKSGFGFRALVDLYTRNESYLFDEDDGSESEVTRSISGPRVQFGLAYRW